jgi:hypothetical protein
MACEYGGDCRTGLYKKAVLYPGLFVKDGSSTLVDLSVYDRILDARPPAIINVGKRKSSDTAA